jgi:beta-glucuronidase
VERNAGDGSDSRVAEDIADAYFMKYQTQQITEMMDNAINHASIMLWAFFNEGPSNNKESCVGYETCANIIKQRDPTRFVTWASNKLEGDVCLHAADVVSFNSYPGWYGMHSDPAEFWNKHANNVRAGNFPGSLGKPFLISETGAGGIYEWSPNHTAAKWTLAYQSQIVAEDVDVAIQNSNISGITLWQFFDSKTSDDTENNTHCDYLPNVYPPICAYINVSAAIHRPGGLNHKGAVDFWRRKKPIYDIVASKYNATQRNVMKNAVVVIDY